MLRPTCAEALGSQPYLRFVGLKGLDEVYDLVPELLGVREADAGAVAFVASAGQGAQAFRKLCGSEPGTDFMAVRSSAWGQPSSRLRVKLEQTLTASSGVPRSRPKLQMEAQAPRNRGLYGGFQEVPDDWEDM